MQGMYKEAKALKKKVRQLEEHERDKHDVLIKEKFVNRSQLLVAKQAKEYQSLKKKHWAQREELDAQRKREFEIIERRFVNVWSEMEARFRKEAQRLERESAIKKMHIRE